MSTNNVRLEIVDSSEAVFKPRGSLVSACIMWGLAAIFYFYDYLLQVSPSAMKPELMQSIAKQAEHFGSLSAYCLYAYGLMQIPAGMLLDRFGPRRIITIACALCALGSLIFGAATTLWVAKVGRLFIGAGAGFALLTCLKIASQWFPQNRYAFMTGLTVTVGFLGAAFGLSSVSEVVSTLGWRTSMYWGGIIGLGLSVLLWVVIRDKKEIYSGSFSRTDVELTVEPRQKDNKTQKDSDIGGLQGFVSVLKNKQTWIASLFAGLMFVPTLAFGGLWGIPFLVEAHGFDRGTAGQCVSLIYIGWVFGGAFWGYISDRLGNRNIPMIIANVSLLAVTIALLYMQGLSLTMMQVLLFALGFFCSAFIVAFAVIAETNPAHLASTASGFGNALNTLWGALAQPLIGFILDVNAKTPAVVGVEQVFTLGEYQQAFLALPICLVISFVFLMFLKETHCKPIKR